MRELPARRPGCGTAGRFHGFLTFHRAARVPCPSSFASIATSWAWRSPILIVVGITAAFSDTYHSAAGRTETARIILREAAMLGIFALGAAVVIIAGGIDLSAGSLIAFSGTIFLRLHRSCWRRTIPTRAGRPIPASTSRRPMNSPRGFPTVALLVTLAIAFLVGTFTPG